MNSVDVTRTFGFLQFASNPTRGVALHPGGPLQLWPLSWPQFSWGRVIDFSHLYNPSSLIMIEFLGFVITVMLESTKSHVQEHNFAKPGTLVEMC